jgi:hypothetical protein
MLDVALPWVILQGGVTSTQVVMGFGVILVAVLWTAFSLIKYRDRGLPEEQLVVRDQVRAAIDQGFVTDRIKAAAVRDGQLGRADLATRLQNLFEAEEVAAPETVREAGRDIRRAIAEAWGETVAAVPGRVLALGEWALSILVFGTLAVSTSVVVEALRADPGRPSLDEVFSYVGDGVSEGIDIALTLLGWFPFADTLASLAFAYLILFLDTLWSLPWVLAALLLWTAAVLFILERRVDIGEQGATLSRRDIVSGLLGAGLFVWLIGAAVAGFLRPFFGLADLAVVADLVGLIVATSVALDVAIWALRQWFRRARRVRTRARGDVSDGAVVAVLAVRGFAGVLRPVAIVATATYALAVLWGGNLLTVIGAFLAAEVEVQLTVLGVIVLVTLAVAWEVRDAAPQIRETLAEIWAREAVRLRLALTSAPYFAVVFAFIVFSGWRLPFLLSLVGAAIIGLLARIVLSYYLQARRRYADREQGTRLPSSIVVGVATVETKRGPVHLLSIGETTYAHEDVADLVETGADVIESRARTGGAAPTVAEWYARNVREYGIADYAETYRIQRDPTTGSKYLAGKLPERVRKRVLDHLRSQPGRQSSRERILEDVCADMPDAVVRRRLAEMIVAGGLRERSDGTVVLKTDIWAQDVDGGQSRPSGRRPLGG